jgi:hypothetical protein
MASSNAYFKGGVSCYDIYFFYIFLCLLLLYKDRSDFNSIGNWNNVYFFLDCENLFRDKNQSQNKSLKKFGLI